MHKITQHSLKLAWLCMQSVYDTSVSCLTLNANAKICHCAYANILKSEHFPNFKLETVVVSNILKQ